MQKNDVVKALKSLRASSPKRNFKQSIDLIINLKELDLKKTDNQIDLFIPLHFSRGKKVRICALVGPELKDQASQVCDKAIDVDSFEIYQKDKKATKKLASEYDFFIAQATIMPKIAQVFGRVFGPRQKMPNPKAGCVVPPNANLKVLYERLQNLVRVSIKTTLSFKCRVGSEDMKDDEIVDNIMSIYNQLMSHLPQEKNNIKSVMIKCTMSPVLKIGGDEVSP